MADDALAVVARRDREPSLALSNTVMARILSENVSVKALEEKPSKNNWLWKYTGKVGRSPAWEQAVPLRMLVNDVLTETNGRN